MTGVRAMSNPRDGFRRNATLRVAECRQLGELLDRWTLRQGAPCTTVSDFDTKQARPMSDIPEVSIEYLIDSYEALLIDAYGVLVTHSGALPGAEALVAHLKRINKAYLIISNDASRLPSSTAADYAAHGLHIDASRIINSGSLVKGYFARHGLRGSRCFVLGPEDSKIIVEQAGGRVVSSDSSSFDVVIIGDEEGFDFVETVDHVLTVLIRGIDRGQSFHLICPNPDLIYPAGSNRYGITAGSVAVLIEAVLAQRYPGRRDLRFIHLGKPHPTIFEEASRRAGTLSLVMIGDQLATDILGANRFGVHSALVRTGLAEFEAELPTDDSRPTFLLRGLLPGIQ